MRLSVGSDHAAVETRRAVVEHLRAAGHEVHEVGPSPGERVDYPDQARAVAEAVAGGDSQRGVLICGTGIGMSIAANKVRGIRAALVHDVTTARLAAQHNDANVLCFGGRLVAAPLGLELVDVWLASQFEERHAPRLAKVSGMEQASGPHPDPAGAG